MNCYICGSDKIKSLYDFMEIKIMECKSCRVNFLNPFPDYEKIKSIYTKEYYNSWGINNNTESLSKMKKTTARNWLDKVCKYKKSGKLLDVGCAMGYFMETADERGLEPYGVELSEFSYKIAKEKFPGKVFNGILEKAPFENNYFDIIVMSDLIEHIRDPLRILKKANQLLKDDGILMISTPNNRDFSRMILQNKWMHYKIEHLFYYSVRSIGILLEKQGFDALEISPAYKALTVNYLYYQLTTYPVPVLTLLVKLFKSLGKNNDRIINLKGGEMLVIAKKKKEKI